MYLTVFISKLICAKANITVCWASGMLRKSSRIPSSCIFVWRFLVSMQFMCYNQGMNLMKNIRLMYIKVAFSNRHFLLSYDSQSFASPRNCAGFQLVFLYFWKHKKVSPTQTWGGSSVASFCSDEAITGYVCQQCHVLM